jgi:osmoprotectant transport system ATP-binding protein
MVLGLIAPDAGRVVVDGEPVTAASAPALRRRIGYVIQDGGLFPHLTAAGNVALVARELGWSKARIGARLDELLALTRLEPTLLSRYPGELSGGQRQRVGLMRALMLDPVLLLLDEPMGALDPLVRRLLQDDLKRIFAELSRTVLLVTHDMAEAAYLGDEVALMRAGHILQRGPMAKLVEAPADPFVAEFLRAQRATGVDSWRAAS